MLCGLYLPRYTALFLSLSTCNLTTLTSARHKERCSQGKLADHIFSLKYEINCNFFIASPKTNLKLKRCLSKVLKIYFKSASHPWLHTTLVTYAFLYTHV